MTLHTRLQRRKANGIFYCRVAIPKKLQHIIGKSEIYTSLKTSNLAIARERVKVESYRIDQLIAQAAGESPELLVQMPASMPMLYVAAPQAASSLTFAELTERFLTIPEKKRTSVTTKLSYRATFRILTEIVGADTPISEISRAECRRVQEVFTLLPANSTKRFPTLTIAQVVEKAREYKLEPMHPVSANTYLMRLSSMLGWAVREGLMPHNPAQGLLLPEIEAAKDKRLPFTTDELITIFSHPDMLRNKDRKPATFWVPMLSLWTGARLNEVCQLAIGDISEQGSIPCMMICGGDGKRLKTANSERLIPLHPRLIELGLLDYVQQIKREGHARLFPSLKIGARGSLSDTFSKDFARYLKKIGVKTPKNCFHSFRHNFRDALREAGIEREIVQALGGWKDKDAGTEDTYGSGYSVERLYVAVSKINYPRIGDAPHPIAYAPNL